MYYIGKSKISPLYSKGSIIYPQIRLPQRYKDIIGEDAHIFETEYSGKRAFFIITAELGDRENKLFEHVDKVLKTDEKVLKLHSEKEVESRLSTLESNIEDIKQLIFQNNSIFNSQSSKEAKKERPSRDLNPSRSLDRAP